MFRDPRRNRFRRKGFRRFVIEQFEQRLLLNSDWHNPARPTDVNNDLVISPLDALLVINELNANTTRVLPTRTNLLSNYYDTSNDSLFSPIDALLIINDLNQLPTTSRSVQRIEGDAEVAPAGFISIPFTTLPGRRGQIVSIATTLNIGREEFNEMGLFVVDGPDGSVNGTMPSSPDYGTAVFQSAQRQVLYSRDDILRTSRDATFPAGALLRTYVLQASAANGDPASHLRARENGASRLRIGWEEIAPIAGWPQVGDRSYDDAIVDVVIGVPFDGNAEPVITAIPNQSIHEQTQLVIQPIVMDADLPDDTLVYTLDRAPSGLTIDRNSGTVRWTPGESQGPGNVEVIIRATDRTGAFDTESFFVTVLEVNRPPELQPIGDIQVTAGQAVTIVASGTDPDLPGNQLTYALLPGSPSDATIDRLTGQFRWSVPSNTAAGLYPVTVRVVDDGIPSLLDDVTFTISVVPPVNNNDPPVIANIPNQSLAELTSFAVQPNVTDPDLPDDLLTFTIDLGPDGATIDRSTGLFSWTPTESQGSGTYDVILRVTDRAGVFATEAFTLTVQEVNVAPVLAAIPSQRITATRPLIFTASAIDADLPANTLSYSLGAGAPAGAAIDAATGRFSWTPDASFSGTTVPVTVIVTDNGTPSLSHSQAFNIQVDSCPFDSALSGWTVIESGGTTLGRGSVTAQACSAVITEGDSFVVGLEKFMVVPATPSGLRFTFSQPQFDESDPAFINDAFELSIVDANGKTLVFPYTANRDAFFNVTEDLAPIAASGVTVNGDTVTVDLSAIAAGTAAKVVLRLINNDTDIASKVVVSNVDLIPINQPAPLPGMTGTGPLANREALMDASLLTDISGSFVGEYSRTSFNEDLDILDAEIGIRNAGQFSAHVPLYVGVKNISDPTVRVSNAVGQTTDGVPLFDFTSLVPNGQLPPACITGITNLEFFNPRRIRFNYELVFYGQLNRSPSITSQPNTEAIVDRNYRYTVNATDPDADPISFSLVTAPVSMTMDATSGVINWTPTSTDIGSKSIIVRAEDGRGGFAEQRYTLNVITPPPNRPPVITSTPVVYAQVSETSQRTALLTFDDKGFSGNSGRFAEDIYRDRGVVFERDGGLFYAHDSVGGHLATSLPYSVAFGPSSGDPNPFTVRASFVEPGTGIPMLVSSVSLTAGDRSGESERITVRAFSASGNLLAADDFETGNQPNDPNVPGHQLPSSKLMKVEAEGIAYVLLASTHAVAFDDFAFKYRASQSPYRYDVIATDPDGDALTYSLSNPPNAMQIDPLHGNIQWSPSITDIGSHDVMVTVNDGHGGIAVQQYVVQINSDSTNHPPVIVSAPITSAVAGEQYLYDLDAVDPDEDRLKYSLTDAPTGMQIDPSTGMIQWNAPKISLDFNSEPSTQGWLYTSLNRFTESQIFSVGPNTRGEPTLFQNTIGVGTPGSDSNRFELVNALDPSLRDFELQLRAAVLQEEVASNNFGLSFFINYGGSSINVGIGTSSIQVFDSGGLRTIKSGLDNTSYHDFVISGRVGQESMWVFSYDGVEIASGTLINTPGNALHLGDGSAGANARAEITKFTFVQSGASVEALVEDGRGGSDTQSFTIDVPPNRPPKFVSQPVADKFAGAHYRYDVDAVDADGDQLTYSLTNRPESMTINSESGLIAWDVPDDTPAFEFAHSFGSNGREDGRDVATDSQGNLYLTGFVSSAVDFDPGPGVATVVPAGTQSAFVAKYSADGELLWVKAPGDTGSSMSNSIVIDRSDNIYLAGNFKGTVDFDAGAGQFLLTSSSNGASFVWKLDTNGNLLWVRATEGNPDRIYGEGLAVDNDGNVVLLTNFHGTIDADPGASVMPFTAVNRVSVDGVGYEADILLVKISSDGNLFWAKHLGDDRGFVESTNRSAIAINAQGEVLLAGRFQFTMDFDPGPAVQLRSSVNESEDIFALKLTSAGDLAWVRTFDGSRADRGVSLDTDDLGNVAVYGIFAGVLDLDPGAGVFQQTASNPNQANLGYNSALISLDTNGQFRWGNKVEGIGFGVQFDDVGSIYTQGSFGGVIDFDPGQGEFNLNGSESRWYTAKYSSAGNFIWATAAGGSFFVVDCHGYVVSTGYYSGMYDFDPSSGIKEYTSTGNSLDAFLVKISMAPVCADVTVRVDDGRGGFDTQSFRIEVGANRPPKIVSQTITDAFVGHPYRYDVDAIDPDNDTLTYSLTTKPSGMSIEPTTGVVSWLPTTETQFGYAVGLDGGLGLAVATNRSGNLVTTGVIDGDIVVTKFDNRGTQVWVNKIVAPETYDQGNDVVVDEAGNIYVTGWFRGTLDFDSGPGVFQLSSNGFEQSFLLKLDPNGRFLWAVANINQGGDDHSQGEGIALDKFGNVYVSGDEASGARGFIAKLDNFGNLVWVKKAATNSLSSFAAVRVDEQGSVYGVGSFSGTTDFDPGPGIANLNSAGDIDTVVWKLDGQGNFVWAKRIGGSAADAFYDLEIDSRGNIVLTGRFNGTVDFDPGQSQKSLTAVVENSTFVMKLDANGDLVWAELTGGSSPGNAYYFAPSLAVDGFDNIYVSGDFSGVVDTDPGTGVNTVTSHGDFDVFITKLSATGSFISTSAFGGTEQDIGLDIAIGTLGHVYTTGLFNGNVDFDPSVGKYTLAANDLDTSLFVMQLTPHVSVGVRVDDGRGGFDMQSFTIDISQSPNVDLQVSDVDPDALVFDGQQLTVSGTIAATIKNQGSQSVLDPFDVLFFEDRNDNSSYDPGVDNVLGASSVTAPLAANGTVTVNATLAGAVLFSGNRVWAFVDSGLKIHETDESNNLGVHLCEYVPQGGQPTLAPDLTASFIRASQNGESVTYTARIGNSGSANAPAGINVAYYDGDPRRGGVFKAVVQTTKQLRPGQFEDVSVTVAGTFFADVWVVADDVFHSTGSYAFTFFDALGAVSTSGLSINSLGQVVGQANFQAPAVGAAFILNNGSYSFFRSPNAVLFTGAFGLNDTGQIVGNWDRGHGFLTTTSFETTTPIEAPIPGVASGNTLTYGINNFGEIAGHYTVGSSNSNRHGFVRRADGTYTTIDYPGAIFSWLYGNNDSGAVVGEFSDVNSGTIVSSHAWIRDVAGQFTSFDVPSSVGTVAFDINNAGQVVGTFQVGTGRQRGFLRSPTGVFTILDVPGSTLTSIRGNNNLGQITGEWSDALGKTHGFIGNPVGQVRECDEENNYYHSTIAGAGEIRGAVFNDVDGNLASLAIGEPSILASGAPLIDAVSIAISPDDSTLYMTDYSANGVFKMPAVGGTPVLIASGPELVNTRDIALSPDGNTLYVAGWQNGNIVRVPAAGGQPTIIASGLSSPAGIVVSPDGAFLYILDHRTGNGQVLRMSTTGGSLTTIGSGFPVGTDITMSDDGTTLYFTTFTSGIFALPTSGGNPVLLAAGSLFVEPVGIALSKDQKTLLIVDGRWRQSQQTALVTLPVEGGIPQNAFVGSPFAGAAYSVFSHSGTDLFVADTGFLDRYSQGLPVISANTPARVLKLPIRELGRPNWIVYLDDDHNGRRDVGERFTTTDSSGGYSFPNLAAGDYEVATEPQSGWIVTSPATTKYNLQVSSGQLLSGIDFGVQQSSEPPINHQPTFTSSAPIAGNTDSLYRYSPMAIDPDNDPLTYDLVVKPTGMAVQANTGIVVWIPTADQVGPHEVTLRVSDGRGGVALQSFVITVAFANSTPVITSRPKGPAVVGLPYEYRVTAQDADSDPIVFSLGGHPTGMTIDASSGVLSWTPATNQVGSPHVEVIASDNHGDSTTQSFDLPTVQTATNRTPTITSIPRGSSRLGSPYLYAVIANDPDGDPLVYSLAKSPTGMTIDPRTGLLTWTPAANQMGANDVQLQVDDGRGALVTQSFTVTVVNQSNNRPPNITSTPPIVSVVGRAYIYDVAAVDPDGDPLVVNLDEFPRGMSVSSTAGSIRWTPTADQLGLQKVVIRVVDGQGGFATQTFAVNVRAVNTPPNVTSTPPTSASIDNEYLYAVQAKDIDGDNLTFAAITMPTGMTIDSQSGLIRWTPAANQVGAHDVAFRIDDSQGGSATQFYTLVVTTIPVNHAPAITSTPIFVATVDSLYQYNVTATDADGDALTFLLQSSLAGMTINATTGVVTWTPTAAQLGTHSITVAVEDGQAGGTQTFTLRVANVNHHPTITSQPTPGVVAGLTYRYDLQASDPDGDPLTYTLDSAPAGMTIDNFGRIAWPTTKANVGIHRIAVSVDDERGLFITQTFDISILADGKTPRVNLIIQPGNTVAINSLVTFIVTATDNVGVESIGLQINGNAVPLDAAGRVSFIATPVGLYDIVASATDDAGNTGLASTQILVFDNSDQDPPVVELTSPLDNAVVTAPIDVVGTVTDANLAFYTLSVAPVGSDSFMELARKTTAVTAGVLARFDPTGLANDSYVLRIEATDTGGNVSRVDTLVQVAGDLKIGNFTLSFTDLTVPVSGIPITVSRTYDSLQANQQDDFGFGWRLEFRDTNLRTSVPASGAEEYGSFTPYNEGARVYVTAPGGRREGFTFRPKLVSGFGALIGLYEPVFVPDAGNTDQLSVDRFTLVRSQQDGLFYGANGLAYNPTDDLNFGGRFYLTTKDGIAYEIDANTGDLLTLSDANRNVLTFSEAAIESNRGPRITFQRDPQGRITSVTDPSGNRVQYQYDSKGDLISVTDRNNNVTRFIYSEPRRAHYLTEIVDPLGRTGVRTEYDAQGRLVKLIDAAGNPVQLIHDSDQSIESVVDALGNKSTFAYDSRGNVITEVDAAGGITRRTYDSANNMLTETDPLGNVTSFTYDADNNLLTTTDPLGNVTRNTYATTSPGFFDRIRGARPVALLTNTTDSLGNTTTNTYSGTNLVSTRDAAGNVTSFAYDAAGNQTSITDAAGNATSFQYDTRGNMTRQVDALGNATVYTYDSNGNQLTQSTTLTTPSEVRTLVTTTQYDPNGHPLSVTDAEGHTSRTEYDKLGNQTATVDALGHRTSFAYDDRGQLIGNTFADGSTTTTTYDALGRRTSSTDRAGRVTKFVYDAVGRLTTTIYPDATPANDADNPRTRTEYDLAGRVTAQIDEHGHRTEFVYDAAGRQTVVRDALGHETSTSYDEAGRTLATIDALGHKTQFVYDALGRQIQTRFADGTTTSTAYDALGRSVAQTDQAGRVTMYEYDRLGRLTAVVDALHQRTQYTYDEAGNLITQQDANGHVTRYEYDGLGRRIATVLPLAQRSTTVYDAVGNVARSTDFNGDTIVFGYDVNNRLTSKTFPDSTSVQFTYNVTGQRETYVDARGTTHWAYDERDRLVSRTDPDGRSISYTYDAAGNRTSLTVPSGTTNYTFDELNRPLTVADPQGGVTRYAYDAGSRLVRTDLPNGAIETRQYDVVNHLLFLENRGPLGVISSYRYTLDATGNRTAVVEDTGRRVDYFYDDLYRLTRESIQDAAAGNRSITYSYDAVGNRLLRTDSVEGDTSYTYDFNDRLLTETLAGKVTSYAYDNNGNTLSKTSAVDRVFYDWDFENRLITADTNGDGADDVAYRYDGDGIRVSSLVGSEETRFLIDSVQPYQQVIEEYTAGGVIKVSYVHGLDLISQNRAGEGKTFYHVDGLGSTRALSNATGGVTDRYVYEAFGRTIGQVGSTGNVYLFAGEQRDAAVGLDYLRARWMDVGVGRFYGMDIVAGDNQSPPTLHRFAYTLDNPVINRDPSGHYTLAEVSVSIAIIGISVITNPYVGLLSNLKLSNELSKTVLGPAFELYAESLRAIADARVPEAFLYRSYDISRAAIRIGYLTLAINLNPSNPLPSLTDFLGIEEELVSGPPIRRLGTLARQLHDQLDELAIRPRPDALLDSLASAEKNWKSYCGLAPLLDLACRLRN